MNVTLVIDPDECVGYGECVAEDPSAVEIDDGGCARVLAAVLDSERAARICAACPVGAIRAVPMQAA
jgi:ferredoxin